ncbi:MAG: TRAP transporter TatT component family protein [Vicinamibacterales bacterium]
MTLPLMFVVLLALQAVTPAAQSAEDPDRLYADREHLVSGLRAAAIWEERLADGDNGFESGWKLARACYWLGGHVPENERRAHYERGIAAAMKALELEPMRPEGHFWVAANMGAMAESFGLRAGIRYRGPIKDELETVLRLDPAYEGGSADRALGRWYFRVPGLFGGSNEKSVEHLQAALKYKPESTATHFFLAETLLEMKRTEEARAALETVIAVPSDPDWIPEDRDFKHKAAELLKTLPPPR